ncbi:Ankyrin repeat and protein kinase domain-containing protein 1 [Hondaea fermentalgiana]|uniref:Ankyrin repeat and protein kinase domain-containing protein 1 n=1 Tax=Hondaea fermentalgiana TaxID=2315210 RepID=A0A2R5GFD4_9STRA|nr:Ankyrin repeat and protein kinase domain-containing protein 1 [Hondaea fermentalgiana]|eukprot:GBG26564.1 Ankyrin repeat and protein kinase domain-containing protein 1 [Hondaea fermentalgiana]
MQLSRAHSVRASILPDRPGLLKGDNSRGSALRDDVDDVDDDDSESHSGSEDESVNTGPLLEVGVDPNSVDSEGWAGLHWAAALGRLDLADLYLEHGADINVQRQDGYAPLHIACEIGDEETTLYLLQHGAKSELQTRYDQFTPLHLACREGHRRCVEALGLAGANLNAQSPVSGFTPLMVAAIGGHEGCVLSLLLVSRDTLRMCQNLPPLDVNICDNDGFGALDLAVLRGHDNVIETLQVQFAASNLSNFTPS